MISHLKNIVNRVGREPDTKFGVRIQGDLVANMIGLFDYMKHHSMVCQSQGSDNF